MPSSRWSQAPRSWVLFVLVTIVPFVALSWLTFVLVEKDRNRDRESDRGAFKTPTLRDVARTAPYMHDGSLPTLEDVVDHYDRGGTPNPTLDRLVRPIGLSAGEKRELVAFLRSLTGRIQDGS
jgi:cytochrome c peroxidase